MIRINTLYSLEDVKDIYYITNDYKIINATTNYEKKQSTDYQGYKYVTLETNLDKNKKVFVHKIVALAFIDNKPYTLINHIDGVVTNNIPSNLEFTDHSYNEKHAYNIGLVERNEKKFEIILNNGNKFEGTVKELIDLINIPKGTLYDNIYNGVRKANKYNISSIKEMIT